MFLDGTPRGAPEKEMQGKFYCYGNFCDFDCVARYMFERESQTDFWNHYSLLCLLYQMAYHLPPETKVPMAPPKETLAKYGGKLTYDEYHQMSNKHQTVMEIYKLPLIPVLLQIEELSKSTNINEIINKNNQKNKPLQPKQKKQYKYIPVDPQTMAQAEANLKRKNLECLQNHYTLDHCFLMDKA